jgi:hypothetical protein
MTYYVNESCPLCAGSGENITVDCYDCGGVGSIYTAESQRGYCVRCNGKGTQLKPKCPRCGGSGVIEPVDQNSLAHPYSFIAWLTETVKMGNGYNWEAFPWGELQSGFLEQPRCSSKRDGFLDSCPIPKGITIAHWISNFDVWQYVPLGIITQRGYTMRAGAVQCTPLHLGVPPTESPLWSEITHENLETLNSDGQNVLHTLIVNDYKLNRLPRFMVRPESLIVKDTWGRSPLSVLVDKMDDPNKKVFWQKLRHTPSLVERMPTLLQTLDQSPARDEQIELAQQLIAKFRKKALELKNALDQLNE